MPIEPCAYLWRHVREQERLVHRILNRHLVQHTEASVFTHT